MHVVGNEKKKKKKKEQFRTANENWSAGERKGKKRKAKKKRISDVVVPRRTHVSTYRSAGFRGYGQSRVAHESGGSCHPRNSWEYSKYMIKIKVNDN